MCPPLWWRVVLVLSCSQEHLGLPHSQVVTLSHSTNLKMCFSFYSPAHRLDRVLVRVLGNGSGAFPLPFLGVALSVEPSLPLLGWQNFSDNLGA